MTQLNILHNPFKLILIGVTLTLIAVYIFLNQNGQTVLTQILFVLGTVATGAGIIQFIVKLVTPRKV